MLVNLFFRVELVQMNLTSLRHDPVCATSLLVVNTIVVGKTFFNMMECPIFLMGKCIGYKRNKMDELFDFTASFGQEQCSCWSLLLQLLNFIKLKLENP